MKKTILIADDEIHILNLIKLTLGDDYNYIEAQNGEEVLEKLQNSEPDLILLDVMMPKLNGFGTCKRIKSNPNTKNIPIALISAKDEDQDVLYGVDIGASAYIKKPFHKDEFIETIKNLI